MKFWRYFLLSFRPEEFVRFVALCEGNYAADVMAEAVAEIVKSRTKE